MIGFNGVVGFLLCWNGIWEMLFVAEAVGIGDGMGWDGKGVIWLLLCFYVRGEPGCFS
jgi:hypothetical protein